MLSSQWRLAKDVTSVSRARSLARQFLASAPGSFEDPDGALLVVSELVTNAILHTSADVNCLELYMEIEGDRLHIEVHDDDPTPPVPKLIAPDEERGRGLVIIDRMSGGWGWNPVLHDGKSVWCDMGPRRSSSS